MAHTETNSHQVADGIFDVTILGGGPTGLFAAFYAGMRGMTCKIIEALPEVGGQLAVLYPEKVIYDSPGFPEILAKDLAKNLFEQVARWDPMYCLGERALTLERGLSNGHWLLATDKAEHKTRTLIIAAGIGAFTPNKLPNCPSVEQFEGNGVHYFVKNKLPFRNKRLLIVGGGDSAVDWALNLKDYAGTVTLVHRRDEFRAHESSVVEMRNSPRVAIKVPYELKEVRGDGHIQQAVIFDNRTQVEETLPVDAILLNLGFKADIGALKRWGLKTVKQAIRVNHRQETNLPGVYAAGDIAAQVDMDPLRLLVTGYGQAAVAANVAYTFINPNSRVFPGHSSEMKL